MSLTAAALRRVAVAVQAAAAYGVAAVLAWQAGWPWPLALLAGAVVVLTVFCASIALAFAATLGGFRVHAHDRPTPPPGPPRPSLGLAGALACYLHECRAVFRMFNWLQPFRSRLQFTAPAAGSTATVAAPPAPAASTSASTSASALGPSAASATSASAPSSGRDRTGPDVLLVHGYGCNHAVWLDFAPHLAAAGYRCEGIDLEPVLGDIDGYASMLLDRMREMAGRGGQPPLLVCHSMGGLAARAAQVLGGEAASCTGIVTLGSPHHGCALARFGSGHNARQMRCGSRWLHALAAAETPAQRARIVSVFSWHDSIAGPAGTSWLDGARHIPLAGIGHVSLLRHPRAIAATLDALAALQAPTAQPARMARPAIFI
ncbi:Acetyltransferase and hydrolase with the alpha/beta hydrolase fold [Cupriavidus sp. H19C3]|uniref:esterase/lipase family protein n=1 Tax=Cupriavidus sp. H19C3 TaxID=3241603 RepID=UPI003BF785C8